MKKIHITALAIVFLLMVSLVFAQSGEKTYVSGDISAMDVPGGVIVQGEQVAVTVPMQGASARSAKKPAAHRVQVNQQAAGAKATHVQNAASLKKGEPKLTVQTGSTETDVYDVRVKNKRGTTNYGVVEQTVTNPKGKQQTEGIVYESYSPSKSARTNDKKMEVSLAAGQVVSYNKDTFSDRYSSNGLAASVSMLYHMNNYLAVGLDYMMFHPAEKSHNTGIDERHYHAMYAHDISLAGKLTFNPWSNFRIYSPMGVGMMNARMKSTVFGVDESNDKWGAAFYIGAGMQYDVTDWMFAGLEYRYAYGFISDKNLTSTHKDRDLQFHTLMLRLGMRF
ncbi:outer membrane protein [Candidatus Avelusimicrobium luingense]|uniref:outer membrane protein n=1 Tax=Candidatus Avelusimicrobium luingense TaxID=3416211 RepID=UPI003D0F5D4F